MSARVTPYLSFAGNAREAMEFYRSIFGGSLDITTYAELHRAQDATEDHLVAHSMLKGDTGVVLMASDAAGPAERPVAGSFAVALGGDEADLTEYWAKLSEGADVAVPLATSSWGALYGRCTDRFGTSWLVNVTNRPS